GDDDAVDVLVLEHLPVVLLEAGPERGDVLQALVVDALGGEVRVDVTEGLDLDVLQPREAALERVALAADADAGKDQPVVGPLDARRSARGGRHEAAADGEAGGGQAELRRERTPGDAVLRVMIASHESLHGEPEPPQQPTR